MKFQRIARGTHAAFCLFLVAGLAACGERISDTRATAPTPDQASPSAVVIGTAPAAPTTGEPAGTSPVTPNTSDVTKSVENQAGPQPGQANDHSNLASKPSQKSGEIATTPAEGKAANSGERAR